MIGITHSFLLLCCSEQTCRQKYTYICIYTYVFFFLFFVILFARRSEDFQSFFGTDFFFSIYFYFACKIYNVFSSFIFERKFSLRALHSFTNTTFLRFARTGMSSSGRARIFRNTHILSRNIYLSRYYSIVLRVTRNYFNISALSKQGPKYFIRDKDYRIIIIP